MARQAGGTRLRVYLPKGFGDRRDAEPPVLAAFLEQARIAAEEALAADPAVDDDVCDTNAVRPELARHTLGDCAQARLGGLEAHRRACRASSPKRP